MQRNDSCYVCEPGYSRKKALMQRFLRQHGFCEICKKNRSSKILVNNGVFVAVCNECANGMKIIENGKEENIKIKRAGYVA